MTDTEPPPTQVDDIVVKGQRKWPSGQFPVRTGYSEPPEGPIPIEVGLEPDPPTSTDPCASPDTALEWNADAAAAEALRRILAYAADQPGNTHNLSNREYGAMICQDQNGGLFISQVRHGDPIFNENGDLVGTVPADLAVDVRIDACGAGALPLGMIHTHPMTGPTGGLPSASDAAWVNALNQTRGDGLGRIYVVSIGSGSSPYRITVYNADNINAAAGGAVGPEVNPDGETCPGGTIA